MIKKDWAQSMMMNANENYVLCWDGHEKNRASSLRSHWETNAFIDVTIACDDDQLGAHKLVLSSSSSVLENFFMQNPNNFGRSLIYLRGTKKKDLRTLLDFIYSGEANIPQDDLADFMKLANDLKIQGLVEEVEENPNFDIRHRRSFEKDLAQKNNTELDGLVPEL